jgi:hypothetical protein
MGGGHWETLGDIRDIERDWETLGDIGRHNGDANDTYGHRRETLKDMIFMGLAF